VAEFTVAIGRDLSAEQVETLKDAGITPERVPKVFAGYSGKYDVTLSCVRVSAADKAEARSKVAVVLGFDPEDLLARPAAQSE
jgi:hypothetical protein